MLECIQFSQSKMNPRYQIFISSTFRDLYEERQAALDAVFEMFHFPAGMEAFPAANSDAWSLIETVIDESDYYVLIIGGLYGSTDSSGISYTEKEYDYARSKGIPIIPFLHKNPGTIPRDKTENSPAIQKKLESFRAKAEKNHHCKYWSSPEDLKAKILSGLHSAIRTTPREGWIRANSGDSVLTLQKLTNALEENRELKSELDNFRDALDAKLSPEENFASGNNKIPLDVVCSNSSDSKDLFKVDVSWNDLLKSIGPIMLTEEKSSEIKSALADTVAAIGLNNCIIPKDYSEGTYYSIHDDVFKTVIYQLIALNM